MRARLCVYARVRVRACVGLLLTTFLNGCAVNSDLLGGGVLSALNRNLIGVAAHLISLFPLVCLLVLSSFCFDASTN